MHQASVSLDAIDRLPQMTGNVLSDKFPTVQPSWKQEKQFKNCHQTKVEVQMHYENLPVQYTEIFLVVKKKKKKKKKKNHHKKLIYFLFLIFAQNIDCGYTLEPPRLVYPQFMFWSKNKKNRYTPAYPSFAI